MKKITIWYLLCAILFPSALLAYFYRQNISLVSLRYILLLFAAELALAALLYVVALLLFRGRPLSAFAACAILWGGFYLMGPVRIALDATDGAPIRLIMLALAALTLALAFAAGLLLQKAPQPAEAPVALFSGVLLTLVFLMNVVPAASHFIRAQSEERVRAREEQSIYQTEFVVDKATDSPNVYWIHCDAMISPGAFEKYYGIPQTEFIEALESRGFAVNRNAQLNSCLSTVCAIPELMCPYFYDGYLADKVAATPVGDAYPDSPALSGARKANELTAALRSKGYYSAINCAYGPAFYSDNADLLIIGNKFNPYDMFFVIDKEQARGASLETDDLSNPLAGVYQDLSQFKSFLKRFAYPLRILYSILKIDDAVSATYNDSIFRRTLTPKEKAAIGLHADCTDMDDTIMSGFLTVLERERQPKFLVTMLETTHKPYSYDQDGNRIPDSHDLVDYPGVYAYAGKQLLSMVDRILIQDPNAVIVLQADHGLNGSTREELMEAFGSDCDAGELWHSVMSAVRADTRYQNEGYTKARSNPLNISRYLINTFVGENYAYVD